MLCSMRLARRGARLASVQRTCEARRHIASTTSNSLHATYWQRQNARPKLTLYTGTDCQLCDEAKHVLDLIKCKGNAPAFDLELYNIRDDAERDVHKWRRAYQYDIPVLHLNGQEIARHRLEQSDVIRKLQEADRIADSKTNV